MLYTVWDLKVVSTFQKTLKFHFQNLVEFCFFIYLLFDFKMRLSQVSGAKYFITMQYS